MMLKAAEYFEQRASPAHAPAPAHHPQAVRPFEGKAAITHAAAPSSARSSGPSGRAHVPVVTPKTGTRFSSTAAQSPAGGPNSPAVTRYSNQVVTANSTTKGRRTTT